MSNRYDIISVGGGHNGLTAAAYMAKAGKKVLVRFREVSDPFTGVFGWVVDNIAFTGASNKPFSSTVADAAKAEKLPVAVAASPTSAHTGKTVAPAIRSARR